MWRARFVLPALCTTQCIVCVPLTGGDGRRHFKRGGMSVFCRRRPGHGSAPAKVSACSTRHCSGVSMVRARGELGRLGLVRRVRKASPLSCGASVHLSRLGRTSEPLPAALCRTCASCQCSVHHTMLRHTRRKTSLAGSQEQLINHAAV